MDKEDDGLVEFEEIKQLPFIDVDYGEWFQRIVPSTAHWDGQNWALWLPVKGKLRSINATPEEGCYFATAPHHNSDLYSKLIDLIYQRASWPKELFLTNGLLADHYALGASIQKLDLIATTPNLNTTTRRRMAMTEIELVFTICRSMFDLFQELLQNLWNRVIRADLTAKRKQLKKSFADIVLSSGTARTVGELVARFDLDQNLAQWYFDQSKFFTWMREFRDRVVHSGLEPGLVFHLPEGLAIASDEAPWHHMPIWNSATIRNNRLGSLRAAMAFIVGQTLKALFDAMDIWNTEIHGKFRLPVAIASKCNIFIKGPTVAPLTRLDAYLAEDAWLQTSTA